jgi:hypothetical protein
MGEGLNRLAFLLTQRASMGMTQLDSKSTYEVRPGFDGSGRMSGPTLSFKCAIRTERLHFLTHTVEITLAGTVGAFNSARNNWNDSVGLHVRLRTRTLLRMGPDECPDQRGV